MRHASLLWGNVSSLNSIWKLKGIDRTGWAEGKIMKFDVNGNLIVGTDSSYTLPTATASVLGGVKIGSGVSIDGAGLISVSTNYAPSSTVSFPGFGTSHVLAAYGDHDHSTIYAPLSVYPATGLTTGYLPYKTAGVLANSPIWTDGGSTKITGADASTLTGTANPTVSTTLIGTGTLFLTELMIGDRITINAETRIVTAIGSNTSLTVDTPFTDTPTSTITKIPVVFSALISSGTPGLIVGNLGTVGIGGPPNISSSYKLRVHGAIWADSFAQLQILDGTGGVGQIRYYDSGATLNFNVYGTHTSENVKGIVQIKSQDLSYSSLSTTILHADANFIDNPSLVIRSRNTGANSYFLMNYHHDSGAYFVTSKNTGGDAGIRFKPNNIETLYLSDLGKVSIGGIDPTAYLHIKAGTATAGTGQLKFEASTLVTTPEAGLMERDATNLYFTPSGTTRKTLTYKEDVIWNQNASAQTANMWINGTGQFGGNMTFGETATSRRTANFINTGGSLYTGVESSVGGGVFTGSSAYAGIVGTDNATNLQFGTNGIVRTTINADGTTDFLSTVNATGYKLSGVSTFLDWTRTGYAGTAGQYLKSQGISTTPVWTDFPALFSGAYADLTGKPTLFSGSYTDLINVPSTFAPSAHTLDSHSNISITSKQTNDILKWDGTNWINVPIPAPGSSYSFRTQLGGSSESTVNNGDSLNFIQGTNVSISKATNAYTINVPYAVSSYDGSGIPVSNGAGVWSFIANNSANWDKYNQWDGGATGLNAATGRTSLGLVIGTDVLAYRTFGTAANSASTDFAPSSTVSFPEAPVGGAPYYRGGGGWIARSGSSSQTSTYVRLYDTDTFYKDITAATTSIAGVMTAADKTNLDAASTNMGKVKLFGTSTYGNLDPFFFSWNTNAISLNTDGSVSQNGLLPINSGAVYTALALKADLAGCAFTGAVTNNSTFTATNFILSSDIRLKTDIQPIQDLSWVKNVNLVEFRMNNDLSRLRYGVPAQELEKIVPDLVYTDKAGMKSVSYTDLLIAKVAYLEAEVEKLKLQIHA